MPKINKYLYGWKLFVNYGQGWEYETFEETLEGYHENRKAYRENCDAPQRWSRGRELNEEQIPAEDIHKADREYRLRRYKDVRRIRRAALSQQATAPVQAQNLV